MNINTKTLIKEFKSSILISRSRRKDNVIYTIAEAERKDGAWQLGLKEDSNNFIAKVLIPDQSVVIKQSQCLVFESTTSESLIFNLRREDGGVLDDAELEARFKVDE